MSFVPTQPPFFVLWFTAPAGLLGHSMARAWLVGAWSPWGMGATSQLLSEGSNASLQVGGEAEDKLGTPFENPDQALPDTNVTLDFSA